MKDGGRELLEIGVVRVISLLVLLWFAYREVGDGLREAL